MGSTRGFERQKVKLEYYFFLTMWLVLYRVSTGTDFVGYRISTALFTIRPPTLDIGIQISIPTVGLKTLKTLRPHLG